MSQSPLIACHNCCLLTLFLTWFRSRRQHITSRISQTPYDNRHKLPQPNRPGTKNVPVSEALCAKRPHGRVSKRLGIMRPYRKHNAWNELPADLQTNVIQSLSGRLPSQSSITDCYFSPHKDRLAWRVTYWIRPPFAGQMGHWFVTYRRFSRPIVELWITDGTGHTPHLVGLQEGKPELGFMELGINGNPGQMLIHGVVWSPREDSLGFVFKDVF